MCRERERLKKGGIYWIKFDRSLGWDRGMRQKGGRRERCAIHVLEGTILNEKLDGWGL